MPGTPSRRNVRNWLIGGAIALVAVVVGGPFVYIHFIEGKAPAPLSLSQTTTTATGTATTAGAASGTTSGVDGTWNVAGSSVAGYRVQETLFGQSNTAVGRTNAVTGSIAISGTQVTGGHLSVDLTTVKSDRSQRDNQFQGRIMNTASFPTATFVLTGPIQLGSIPAEGTTITRTATGNLTLHGTTKDVTLPVQAHRAGSTITVSGSIPTVFADYGIDNPSGGPATTGDTGTLEFLLNFTHA